MFNAVKVFSATMWKDREALGEKVTDWIGWTKPKLVDKLVLQSSDSEFHCLSIIIFYQEASNENDRPSRER